MGSNSVVLLGLDIQIWSFVVQVLTLIGLFIYVVETRKMASGTWRSVEISEKALQELRDTRDEETAPYVIASFGVRDQTLFLIVKNIGKTMAKNVQVTFGSSFETLFRDAIAKVSLPDGIPSMPPTYEISIPIGNIGQFRQSGPVVKVNLVYYGGSRSQPRTATYVHYLGMFRDDVSAGTTLY
jgi:hypothetical protein